MSDQPPTGTPTPVPDSQEQQEQAAPGFWTADYWEKIGKFRDGLLVAGGLLYVLGYAVWSFNAWRDGLGILPALDFQYLVAGVVPALILVGAIVIVRFILLAKRQRKLDARAEQELKPEAPADAGERPAAGKAELAEELAAEAAALKPPSSAGERLAAAGATVSPRLSDEATGIALTWLFVGGGVMAGVAYLLYKLGLLPKFIAEDPERWAKNALTLLLILIGVLMGLAESLAQRFKSGEPKRFSVWQQLSDGLNARPKLKVVVSAVPVVIGITLTVTWLRWVYPSIPQALGGVQPRCAQLDLARKDVSADTLRAVSPSPSPTATPSPAATPSPEAGAAAGQKAPPGDADSVVRTDEVEVLFSGSDYMLIRARDKRVYEIKKDVVQAVAVAACAEPN